MPYATARALTNRIARRRKSSHWVCGPTIPLLFTCLRNGGSGH